MVAVSREATPKPLAVHRLPIELHRDEHRVITRLFALRGGARLDDIIDHINRLSDAEVDQILGQVLGGFEKRHEHIAKIFEEHFYRVAEIVAWRGELSLERRLLVGSYFTMEYSIEAAALFNPSITPHPNQSGVGEDGLRFIMSLRATGEGHVSSVVFRTGVIDRHGRFLLEKPPPFSAAVHRAPDQHYVKHLFRRKLGDMAANMATTDRVLNPLPERFTLEELRRSIIAAQQVEYKPLLFKETIDSMLWLAQSNYQLELPPDADIPDVVLFPHSDNEARGIEDLRLVRFTDEDGSVTYYGTFTAHNDFRILPMLLETSDFRGIQIHTLNGACARDKGMALFPRRVNGHYCMCSRIDGQNLYIMYSDMIHFWETAEKLASPEYPWEMMLIGNCGSPIETEEGWLLITHGVGPMRRYCIGAMLLDLEDPLKIIGRLREPLLMPSEAEREGYTPNVVYSCGSVIHAGRLYIPYAMSDSSTTAASVNVAELVNRLLDSPPQ